MPKRKPQMGRGEKERERWIEMEKSEINKKMLYHHDWTLLHHSTIIFIVWFYFTAAALRSLTSWDYANGVGRSLKTVWCELHNCAMIRSERVSRLHKCGGFGLACSFDFDIRLWPNTAIVSLSPAVLSALRSDVSCKLMKSCKFFFFCSQLYVTFYSLLSTRRASLELGLRYSNPFASFAGTFCAMATSRFLSLSLIPSLNITQVWKLISM